MKSNIMPKSFTVIVPSYNCTRFIAKNIASIENQNYPKNLLQILVIDDGSTDNLKQLIEALQAKSSVNIEYHYKENGHWGSVMNYVNEHHLIKNDIVVILDADDIFLKNCFNKVNKHFGDLDALISCYRVWNGKHCSIKIFPYLRCYRNLNAAKRISAFFWPGCIFYKKEIFASIGKIKEKVPYQDNILAGRALRNSKKVQFWRFTSGLYYRDNVGNTMSAPWDERRYQITAEALDEMAAMGWQLYLFIFLFINGFRKQCNSHNKKFFVLEKIKFNFFPIYVRWIAYLIYLCIFKKYIIVDHEKVATSIVSDE